MKYVFFALLVVNLVLLLWETGIGHERRLAARAKIQLPEGVEILMLIRELPAIPHNPAKLEDHPVATNPDHGDACLKLGPYLAEPDARSALERIQAPPNLTTITLEKYAMPDGYWVLYPKAKQNESPLTQLETLEKKGLPGLWLFRLEDWEGSISLGLHENLEAAEAAQKAFAERMITTEIQPRLHWLDRYWISIHGANPASMKVLLRTGSYPTQPCP